MLYIPLRSGGNSVKRWSSGKMSGSLTLISLLPLLFLVASPSLTVSASKCHSGDRKALLAINAHLGSPAALSSWRAPHAACCDWAGVECYMKSNRVRNLDFRRLNISGTIPPAIGDLKRLESIAITGSPEIAGTIPSSITRLKRLVFLDLSRNSLSGPIPDYLSKVTSLTYLDLSFNKFDGAIPPSLPNLNNLGALLLTNNRLTGPIPDFTGFGDGNIFLSHNLLSGPIPKSLAGLGWGLLDLSYNRLSGDASFLFSSSSPATEIHLHHNQLRFDLSPVSFPLKLTELELNNNYIYGSIPAQINQVTVYGLTKLNVSYNELCGQIPQGVVTEKFGMWSYLHNKCLCGKPLPACK